MEFTELLLSLVLVFAPIVAWSHPKLRAFDFRFADSLLWWLACIEGSALVTLWLGCFRRVPFFVTHLLLALLVTYTRTRVDKTPSSVTQSYWGEGLLAALLIAAAWIPYATYLRVPSGGDLLAYHLPMAAQWVQTQSILAKDTRVWFYPGGYELLTAVFFLLTRSDLLWFVPDVLAWTLLSVSLYELLTALGLGKNVAGLSVAAITLTPVVRETLGGGANDLWVAALVIATTKALLCSLVGNSRQSRAAGIIGLGALAAAKYSALPWLLLGAAYLAFRRKDAFRPFRALEVSALGVTMLIGLSFFARNLWLAGNPVYPTGLGPFIAWGDTSHLSSILAKLTPEQLTASALIHAPGAWPACFQNLVTKAPVLPIAVGLSVLFAIVRPKQLSFDRRDGFMLAAVALGVGIFVTQPLVVENVPQTMNQIARGKALRFAIAAIVLMSGWACSKVPRRYSAAVIALLLVYTLAAGGLKEYALILIVGGVLLYWLKRFTGRHIMYLGLVVPLGLVIVTATIGPPRLAHAANAYRRSQRYRIAPSLQRSECSLVIVLSTALRAYPLLGSSFKHRVVSVGVSLPAEEFKKQVDLNDASVLVVSKESGDPHSSTYGTFPPETARLLPLLGPDWEQVYDDGFAIAFARPDRIQGCWTPPAKPVHPPKPDDE